MGVDCRYFICDAKLSALGWRESTPWEAGLQKTVDWYLRHAEDHWDKGGWMCAMVAVMAVPALYSST